MGISLDGIDYRQDTPMEIALRTSQTINNYCANNQIRNSRGEIVRVDVDDTSIPWLLLFAHGYEVAVLQEAIIAVGSNFNFGEASDAQILTLAEVGKTRKRNASPTTFLATVSASSTVHIIKENIITYKLGYTTIVFRPANEVTIPAGTTRSFIFIADILGPYNIEADSIEGFDEDIYGIDMFYQNKSMPGHKDETVGELRQRLQFTAPGYSEQDRAQAAIEDLPGITFCSIFFNFSNQDDMIINGITVSPRCAIMYIQGYSDDIAKTYYQNMNAQTTLVTGQAAQNMMQQDYVSRSGQTISVYFMTPSFISPLVKVYIDKTVLDEFNAPIQDAVMELNGTFGIGRQMSVREVISKLSTLILQFNVLGAELSTDHVTWQQSTSIDKYQVIELDRANITLEYFSA
jgi:hypothetical protein